MFGQFTDRFHLKHVCARDRWHLFSRLLRKILCHTICVLLNQKGRHDPLGLVNPLNG